MEFWSIDRVLRKISGIGGFYILLGLVSYWSNEYNN